MNLCTSCKRYVRDEVVCPFCAGAPEPVTFGPRPRSGMATAALISVSLLATTACYGGPQMYPPVATPDAKSPEAASDAAVDASPDTDTP